MVTKQDRCLLLKSFVVEFKKKKSQSKIQVTYHQGNPSFRKYKLLCYSPASQVLADFGAHLLKLKHANRPVCFRVSPSYFPVRLSNDMRI